jgi:hypothetical protein
MKGRLDKSDTIKGFRKKTNRFMALGLIFQDSRFGTKRLCFQRETLPKLGLDESIDLSSARQLFGLRNYFGKETSYYSNLIFESIIGNTNNKYKVGASFL